MKRVMVGVGLGLAAVSQAHAWNPGVQSVQNVQASGVTTRYSPEVVQRGSAGVTHCHLPANRTGNQAYQCSGTGGQIIQRRQQRQPQPRHQRVQHPQNQQQDLQVQRAQRQAMFAAQAKRKALLLAQQRKRAAMLEQQKRRKIQLAQQQQRAAHQAAMLAAKKKRAALLVQQKRRAMQQVQQRRQQAQRRAALLAQQKNRRIVQQQSHRVTQPQVQPRVTFSQQVITQRVAASNFQPRGEVISRRIITTHVSPSQLANTQAVVQQVPRTASGQGIMQQSVDYHDQRHSAAWQGASQNVGTQNVQRNTQTLVSPTQQSVAHHEARLKQQRLQQIRAAQIAAQQQRQRQQVQQSKVVRVAPAAPAKTALSLQPVTAHSASWQRQSEVRPHTDNAYAMYQG